MSDVSEPVRAERRREPVLNVPGPLVALVVVLLAIHAAIEFGPFEVLHAAIVHGSFIPRRLTAPGGGWEAWTMWLSHAFLHGSWGHVGMNSLWLVIFGTPLFQRIGLARFATLFAVGAIGAAATYAALNWGDSRPVIGASGAVSALAGAAARFAFLPGARQRPRLVRRMTLPATFANVTTLAFVAVFVAGNLVTGTGLLDPDGPSVAWQAHIGGFLVGLLAFPLFDQRNRSDRVDGSIER